MRPMRTSVRSASSQRGALTLLLGLLLLMGSTILTLSSVRVGIMEQRIANNERRGMEAQQAAQAGLEYALAMLGQGNDPKGSGPSMNSNGHGNDFTYNITIETDDKPGCTEVTSLAEAGSDPSIHAVAIECFQLRRLLSRNFASDRPPLVVDGCLSGVTGTPKIYPAECDYGEDCERISLASSALMTCLNDGHLDLEPGDMRASAFESGDSWNYTFQISKDEFQERANSTGNTQFHWVTVAPNGNNWKEPLGSPEVPAYLVFAKSAGCVNVKANIYGIVYFEHDNAKAPCDANGWGNIEVYGSVVFAGDLIKLNANTEFHDWTGTGGGELDDLDPVLSASRIPGSWRDWD